MIEGVQIQQLMPVVTASPEDLPLRTELMDIDGSAPVVALVGHLTRKVDGEFISSFTPTAAMDDEGARTMLLFARSASGGFRSTISIVNASRGDDGPHTSFNINARALVADWSARALIALADDWLAGLRPERET